MTQNRFSECKSDNCVDVRTIGSEFIIVALYVDDVFIASRTMNGVKLILEFLKKDFSIKEMGDLHYYLGIKVERIRAERKLFLSQKAYVDQLIDRLTLRLI